MDGKLELQDDTLSVEGSDHFCVQENKPLTEWKVESVDSANDLTSEVKTEEDSVGLLISCPAQNFKSEVEFSSAHTQKEELSLKEMTEENKVCAESFLDFAEMSEAGYGESSFNNCISVEGEDIDGEENGSSEKEMVVETEPMRSRKRTRCPEQWKRTKEKEARYKPKAFPKTPICKHPDGKLRCNELSMQDNKNTTMLGMVIHWFLSEAPENIKKIEIWFPIVGHSFIPPNRVFGNLERQFQSLSVIENSSGSSYEETWKLAFPVSEEEQETNHYKECQQRTCLVQGEPFYNFESGEPKSLNKKGKHFQKGYIPNSIPMGVILKEAKIRDIKSLLELHFGEDWVLNANLSFYTEMFNQQQGLGVADLNENEGEHTDVVDFELMDEEEPDIFAGPNRDSAVSALCEAAREAGEQLSRSLKERKKRFECESCGRRYTRKNDLRIHTLVHSGLAPYSCDVCGQGFTQLGSRRRHAALHRDERPFKCGQCGRSFRRSESLEIHSRHHTGEKPYRCDVCAKCFTQSRYLRIHECLHTGVRPFKCQVCGKRFVVQAKLRAHARVHSGEEPIKCRGCGEMEHHQRQHTGEELSKCKCPRNAEDLKVHVKENSLKCDVLWKMSLAFRESE
ncbi:hypothetical protein ANN_27672 [Periplaneta americana]|uniref:C2H2-type domain-containing protein n=1 Tax=Periplaneta americana TaxID=6978 RepID=A0ABQ8RWW8_PERAM|nr:hypothetical protein ANN_27672 [Periplaneta americana]